MQIQTRTYINLALKTLWFIQYVGAKTGEALATPLGIVRLGMVGWISIVCTAIAIGLLLLLDLCQNADRTIASDLVRTVLFSFVVLWTNHWSWVLLLQWIKPILFILHKLNDGWSIELLLGVMRPDKSLYTENQAVSSPKFTQSKCKLLMTLANNQQNFVQKSDLDNQMESRFNRTAYKYDRFGCM